MSVSMLCKGNQFFQALPSCCEQIGRERRTSFNLLPRCLALVPITGDVDVAGTPVNLN